MTKPPHIGGAGGIVPDFWAAGFTRRLKVHGLTANRGWIVAFRMPPCHVCDNDQDSVKSSGGDAQAVKNPSHNVAACRE